MDICQQFDLEILVHFYQYNIYFCVRKCRVLSRIKFKNGEFDIEDKERSGRPKVHEDAELESLFDQDSCRTQQQQYDGQYFE